MEVLLTNTEKERRQGIYRVRLILYLCLPSGRVRYCVHYLDLPLSWQQDTEEFLSQGGSRAGLIMVKMAELEMAV